MQDRTRPLSFGADGCSQESEAAQLLPEAPESVLSDRLRQALPRLSRIAHHAALLGPAIIGAGEMSANSWGKGVGC